MGNFFSSIFGGKEGEPKPDDPAAPTEETSPPPPSPPSTGDDFAKKLLDAQNEYRLKHGASPLVLDTELCTQAENWARNLASTGNLKHADTEDGENIAFAYPELTAQGTADMWYNEIKDYDFRNPGFTSGTGHFTQVVWLGSEKFGAGIATGSNGMFAVGRYRPAGNVTNPGFFEENVLPAK